MRYLRKRCGIYLRVSTDEQRDNGFSIDNQLRNLQDYASKHEYDIIDVYNDAGYSGKDLMRPNMQRLLNDIKSNKIDVLLAIKVDRLTRNGFDGYWLLNYCEEYKVKIELSLEPYDVSTANGEMIYGMNLIFGQRERKEIGARTKRGLEEMALQKVHPNKAPYGYIRNKDTGHLQIDPIASEVVKDVYKLYTKNHCIRPITKMMKKDNRYLKSGKWCDNRIYNILSNPIYNGTYHHGRKSRRKEDILIVENYCPKIIDDKIFNQVQNLLIKNKNSNYGSHIHLFTSLVKCPSCGNIMSSTIAYKNRQDGTRKEYYFIECRNDNCKDKGKNYNTDKLENKLITMLNELMVYSIMNDHIITIPNVNNESEMNKINKAIEKLNVQEKKLVDLYVNSDLDVAVINNKNKMVKKELEVMTRKLNNLNKGQVLKFDTNLLSLFNEKEIKTKVPISNIWNTLTRKTKREIINKYILSIEVKRDDDYNIEITSINFNKDFLQNSIFNFTTHIINAMSKDYQGIKLGKYINEQELSNLTAKKRTISIKELLPTSSILEDIQKYYGSGEISVYPIIKDNEIVDYQIVIPKEETKV
ncbi:MAG: recombinase family protein [Erysipelotrichaceae bacterium]|nr:recombinase family protein [Erysipelotrichaceae bacterium]